MDLLKSMLANRQAMGATLTDPKPAAKKGEKPETKSARAKRIASGTREMRHFIIDEKPSKKVVRDHFLTLVEQECVSSDSEGE
jgi:hypothetical protein